MANMSLTDGMVLILENACPFRVNIDGTEDLNEYYIETHCVGHLIRAKKVNDTWIIVSVHSEDC